MTVPWGRRERWGVESGRVADFVGLLESAELDASGSGGYCVIGGTYPMVLNDHIRVVNGDMYPPGICP